MKKFSVLFLMFLFSALSAVAENLRFVQVTDVRYSKDGDNTVFEKTVQDINKQKDVEFVVFTGDNIAKPSQDDLSGFIKEAKKLNCPFYVAIGDKDVNKHKDLSKVQYGKFLKKNIRKYKPETLNYAFEKKGMVFIVADGAKDVIPSPNGFYKDSVVNWVEEQARLNKGKNIIIFQHFPLIPPVNKENYMTFKPEEYLMVLKSNENIKAVFSGHFGVNSEQTVNGVEHITSSGIPYYRIVDVIDCETKNPTIWAELKEVRY